MTPINKILLSLLSLTAFSCCRASITGVLWSDEHHFVEQRFRASVDRALKHVERILDLERSPRLAEAEDHTYHDKYTLTEYVTNTAIAAHWNVLDKLFSLISDEDTAETSLAKKQRLFEWVHKNKKAVTLRFQGSDNCTLIKEEEVEVVDQESHVETETGTVSLMGDVTFKKPKKKVEKTRVIRKVKRYHWNVQLSYQFNLFAGSGGDTTDSISTTTIETQPVHLSRTVITNVERSPVYGQLYGPLDINISWLLKMLLPPTSETDAASQFAIDRNAIFCKTPRRNDDIQTAFKFSSSWAEWASLVRSVLQNWHAAGDVGLTRPQSLSLDTTVLRAAETIFHPVAPLMENQTTLGSADANVCVREHGRTLSEAMDKVSQRFKQDQEEQGGTITHILTPREANIALLCQHIQSLTVQYLDSVAYVEDMLQKQLTAAIGKELTVQEFGPFTRFYWQRLFGPTYAPTAFSHSIRRPEHYPDGILSVEERGVGADNMDEPIETMVRHISGNGDNPVYIPINAATKVAMTGDCYLHGWMQHQFRGNAPPQVQLVARARQFSSFMLVLGTMAGPNQLHPQHAVIMQNKDEVIIPLLTTPLPSAKEFKDAVASLSPEQQAFAKAFRSMQLESSVFAVAVVQLKPQLEKLLGLPDGALTKEIQLTQDLMSLFVEYQIPSDLLSFDGPQEATNKTDKVNAVKTHVEAVLDVIERTKEKQLEEEKRKEDLKKAQREEEERMMTEAAARLKRRRAHAYNSDEFGGSEWDWDEAETWDEAPYETSTSSPLSEGSSDTKHRARSLRAASADGKQSLSSAQGGRFESVFDESEGVETMNEDTVKATDEEGTGTDTHQSSSSTPSQLDFTAIPKMLDAQLEKHDSEGYLRSTTIKVGSPWTRKRQENLLKPAASSVLSPSDVAADKKNAFDLLDALSRSGSLAIDASELHVIVGVTHFFAKNIIATIIEDNINPIEKMEKSALMIASTIHDEPASVLIGNVAARRRLSASIPALFEAPGDESLETQASVASSV